MYRVLQKKANQRKVNKESHRRETVLSGGRFFVFPVKLCFKGF